MPSKATIAAHGGLRKVRTLRLPDGRYRHVYVFADGTSGVGEVKRKKVRNGST